MRTYVTQEALAGRAELHPTEIGLLERGQRVPRIDTLLRLAAALGIEPAELLAGVHVQPPEGIYRASKLSAPGSETKPSRQACWPSSLLCTRSM